MWCRAVAPHQRALFHVPAHLVTACGRAPPKTAERKQFRPRRICQVLLGKQSRSAQSPSISYVRGIRCLAGRVSSGQGTWLGESFAHGPNSTLASPGRSSVEGHLASITVQLTGFDCTRNGRLVSFGNDRAVVARPCRLHCTSSSCQNKRDAGLTRLQLQCL